MSVTIKGITYNTSAQNLDCSWSKYNGNKNQNGNGSSDGTGETAVTLANAPGYPYFRVADYRSGAAYPVRIDYYNGNYNIGWYKADVLPTAYISIKFDNGVGNRTYTYGVGGNFPSTSKTGYSHSGWKIDGVHYAATAAVTNGWISERWSSGTKNAYAEWTANTYTVSYNANGGSGAPGNQTKTYGVNLTLSSTKPTRTGYTFLRWNTKADGTGTSYNSGGTYSANSAVTLYAVWQANVTYIVSYDANGGSGAPATQSGYSGTSLTLSSTRPTKADTTATVTMTYDKVEDSATLSKYTDTVTLTTSYTFVRWNTAADGSGTSYEPGQTITLNQAVFLYAQYSTNVSGSVELPTGTLDQHDLQGFSKSTSDIVILNSPYTPTGSETLYAIWAPNDYAMLKIPGSFTVNANDILRLVGTKGNVNDGIYTVASSTISGGYTTIYFLVDENGNGDLPESIDQDASELNLEIYGAGTYVPPFDYICAKDNRLWGCSSKTRTIYASALGIPDDFEQFEGTADDSYQLTVATPGDFTGCVTLNSSVIFTKQHCIHKMLGGFPAEYALYTYNVDGVSYTNGASLLNVNGVAMYVGEHGVLSYNGSQQTTFSLNLRENEFQNAKACFDGEKYLLAATRNGEPVCYVFDTRYGIWIEKDYGGEVACAVHLRDKDYVLVGGTIYMTNTGLAYEGQWEIWFKPFIEMPSGKKNTSMQFFNKKRYQHIRLRLQMEYGSYMDVAIRPNEEGEWTMAHIEGVSDRVVEYPLWTPRTDSLQLKLSGQGEMTILGIEREFILGSAR